MGPRPKNENKHSSPEKFGLYNLFSNDCRLIIPKHETLNKNKMYGNTDMTLKHMIKPQARNTYALGLFGKPSLFTKIKLKWPLFRGSHFKIYFYLECRGNRGSCQNFHRIPFSKDRVLINPNHYVTLQIYYDHILI